MTPELPPRTWPRLLAHVAVFVGIANLVSEVLIYGAVVVPSLEEGAEITPMTWAWMYVPVLIASAWVTLRIETYTEAFVAGLVAGVVAQVEKWALAVAGAAGHDVALAAVAPSVFWTVHFARMTFGFVVLFVILQAASRALLRRARGLGGGRGD